MKFSTNTLRRYQQMYNWSSDIMPNGLDELVTKIGAQLGAVEEVIDVGSKYSGAVVVKVVSCEQHPNADRLHVCKVDDGGVVKDVKRESDGYVQVVCGAPNVREGLSAVWLPPGATVPSTYDSEPFTLEARELRGVVSNGMLASPKELAVSDSHEGLLEIDDDIKSGTTFVEAYNLEGDYVIDIENKMFTHRPDCFGWMGIARELAGIQNLTFTSPEWYVERPELPPVAGEQLPLIVKNELPDLVPRFIAITMRDVAVGPSPVWLQLELTKVGQKSINNVVDLTNYLMLLTGQPLHAYDYDKVAERSTGDATIVVRKPQKGETVALLNGKTIEPRAEAIMIATDKELIGVGGVMGGADTEVDNSTKNIIIECANFDMYSVRRTSMAHGLFTDAVARFNKGQSPHQNLAVLLKMVADVQDFVGGTVAGEIIDDNHVSQEQSSAALPSIDFVNKRLGIELDLATAKTLLTNVECVVTDSPDGTFIATPPFWRTDIHIPEDVVEEIGRLYGFDKLRFELPVRTSAPAVIQPLVAYKAELRQQLAALGANEVLTYSFVHGQLLQKVGQDTEQAFKISNALSPDLQYYRLSLTPSLLSHVHANIKAGHDTFALFEINKTHTKLHADDDNGVPKEFESLALVYASKAKSTQTAYYWARVYLDELARKQGVALEYRPITDKLDVAVAQPFDPNRSALVYIANTDTGLGIIGEYKQSVRQQLKLPAQAAGFEIDIEALLAIQRTAGYQSLSRYPSISQDICLQVADTVSYAELTNQLAAALQKHASDETVDFEPIDIYTSDEKIAGKKRITYRITVTSHNRTLTEATASDLLEKVAGELAQSLSAERI